MKAKGLKNILTKDRLVELYFNKGMSFKEIGIQYDCNNSNIAYYFRKYGLKGRELNGSFKGKDAWNKGKSVKSGTISDGLYLKGIRGSRKYGKDHHNFKGGWLQNGYKYICIKGRQVALHHYLIEQKIGRVLTENEVVHHINHYKLDNRIENLKLLTRREHIYEHPACRRAKFKNY